MDEHEEEPWPRYSANSARGQPGGWLSPSPSRESRHDQRISEHVRRRRPPRDHGLSRDEIVAAAIAVADAEGPAAISMRRLARDLQAGAMSLYWHVASKEELIELMLDRLEAETALPEPTGDWRADLTTMAHRQRAGMLRHPWVVEFVASRPPSGPHDARNLELMLGMLNGHGLDARTIADMLMTVLTYVMGAVVREVQEMRSDRNRAQIEATMTAEEIEAEHERFRAWLTGADQYPNIQRMMAANVDPDAADTRDERFEFGLSCVLDGIAARLPAMD